MTTQKKAIARFQYVTQEVEGRSHDTLVKEACEAGCTWIQLRDKLSSDEALKPVVEKALEVCEQAGAKLILNDRVELGRAMGVHGVHIGQNDMPMKEARSILGKDVILGGTANTFEHIQQHLKAGADYIGLGPYRLTKTKKELSPVLGTSGYKTLLEQCKLNGISIPVVAIGGIQHKDVEVLKQLGLHGIAVASLLTYARDKKTLVSSIHQTLQTTLEYA